LGREKGCSIEVEVTHETSWRNNLFLWGENIMEKCPICRSVEVSKYQGQCFCEKCGASGSLTSFTEQEKPHKKPWGFGGWE
jgi:uncharacterized Zn finger protein (UPF0148 family)